jgi:hypothetical protein
MRTIRFALAAAVLGLTAGGVQAAPAGDGLRLAIDNDPWPRWQASLSVIGAPSTAPDGATRPVWSLAGARLSGDRYFDLGRIGDGGGLRATSALLLGVPSVALGAPLAAGGDTLYWRSMTPLGSDLANEATASTYVGLGYSAWWRRSGLGFSADLGLLAQHTGAPGRAPVASSLDLTVRSFQLSPVFQLHLSYAF